MEAAVIEVTGYHHEAIYVTDLERSMRFYGGVLSLKEIDRPEIGDPGAWFELGNGQQLHVTVLDEVKTKTKRHFAIEVADFQEAWRILTASDVKIDGEPRKRPYDGSDSVIIYDPDGHRIEVVHHPEKHS